MATKKTPANDDKPSNHTFAIISQYIKDLSFENPLAPKSLLKTSEKPNINISIDVKTAKIEETIYEVCIIISIKAEVDKNTLFIVELTYAGIFKINIPENEKEYAIMVHCPYILFPFARKIIADATINGGFPPLMLDPIDFSKLYEQHKQKNKI